MEKHILEQYTDLREEEQDLNRRIQLVEDQLAKMEEKGYVVSDSVTCGKKGSKLSCPERSNQNRKGGRSRWN